MKPCTTLAGMLFFCAMAITSFTAAAQDAPELEMNGFVEVLGGLRLRDDPYEQDASVMEQRLQIECRGYADAFDVQYRGDVYADWVLEEVKYDTRELWFFARPTEYMDVKIGRQILTWGTGDLVFLNDLFPKDWQSFFIGRDPEYLKAPSDAVKLGFFSDIVNVDLVYTPQFDPDRYITGEYISHWSPLSGNIAGDKAAVAVHTPDTWFDDHEIAIRVHKNMNNYEYALYGYRGFWKTPDYDALFREKNHHRLHVYGGSVRGSVFSGIGNLEFAYYRSLDDSEGSDPSVSKSEIRGLIGYTQDIAKDCNLSVQYFLEAMLDYDRYEETAGETKKDEYRHVLTIQATKLLLNQTLELSVPVYYSPSDNDGYLRPRITYDYTDDASFVIGGNLFFGDDSSTFFGQLKNNTNVYTAFRLTF